MKVSSDTIARTIILLVAIINQIMAVMGKGKLDIAESDVYQIISLAFTIVSSVIAWWKNNSFTEPALAADQYMKKLKE